jgi:hypothetical protein
MEVPPELYFYQFNNGNYDRKAFIIQQRQASEFIFPSYCEEISNYSSSTRENIINTTSTKTSNCIYEKSIFNGLISFQKKYILEYYIIRRKLNYKYRINIINLLY